MTAEELLARVCEQQAAMLEELKAIRKASTRVGRDAGKLLLSKRAAARLLGVDRETTLEQLIKSGQLATVPGPQGVRIPRANVDALLAQGAPGVALPAKPRRAPTEKPRKSQSAGSVGDAIRNLEIGP